MAQLRPYLDTEKGIEIDDHNQVNNIAGKTALLARKIEKQIKKKNLTKQQFAQLMDVQPSVVSRWLSGSHNFTVTTLFEIEQNLQFRIVDLGSGDAWPRFPQVFLHLSVENSMTHIDNPDELIDVVVNSFKHLELPRISFPHFPSDQEYPEHMIHFFQYKGGV